MNSLQTFNVKAPQIQELIGSHKELTRAVSHELRTPVTRLRFSLEMLNNTNDSTARKRFLQEMDTDIDELDELLGELLSYARMESSREFIEYSPVILADWLENQTMVFKRDNHKKTVQVTHAGLPSYVISCMDPKLMARALNNLFQNASRYAEQYVHIDFTYQDGEYKLSVDDDGPGLPAENHDRIFEPFTRIDSSRDRKSGGYGLGLAIVRQIAEAHQGTIEITPSKLGGTRFLLTFPGSCQLPA
jgi:signal transduction histidine kinase